MSKTLLFLIRHGATRLNLETPYRLQGSEVDEPLAEIGFTQAADARDALRGYPLRAVYCSPMQRAMQTAIVVAEPHALVVKPVAELREGSVGRWENRTWDDIKASEPDAYQHFINDPGTHGYAGGENFTQVLSRVKPVFWQLLQQHAGQCIAVVAHQIVNRVIVADLMGLPFAAARRVKFSNGGVTVISTEQGQPHLVSLNMVRS
jgi:broad specificity phosphatase PhoE